MSSQKVLNLEVSTRTDPFDLILTLPANAYSAIERPCVRCKYAFSSWEGQGVVNGWLCCKCAQTFADHFAPKVCLIYHQTRSMGREILASFYIFWQPGSNIATFDSSEYDHDSEDESRSYQRARGRALAQIYTDTQERRLPVASETSAMLCLGPLTDALINELIHRQDDQPVMVRTLTIGKPVPITGVETQGRNICLIVDGLYSASEIDEMVSARMDDELDKQDGQSKKDFIRFLRSGSMQNAFREVLGEKAAAVLYAELQKPAMEAYLFPELQKLV